VLSFLVACAVCATADPTLVAATEEQPYRNRVRVDLDARVGHVAAGDASLDDRRVETSFSWAPSRAFEIGLAIPFLFRRVDGAFDERTMGDVEIRAQALAYEARGSFGRRRFGILGALKLPTSPIEYDEHGAVLPSALQPGCGAIAPTVGAYYAAGRGAWSTFVSGSIFLPLPVRDGPCSSDSTRFFAHVQYQPKPWIAGRLGAFARIDASGQLAQNVDDPNSGGFIAYVTAEALVSPVPDLVLTFGAFVPIVEAFRGQHHESAVASFDVAYDF
jgi:hypothetical protein